MNAALACLNHAAITAMGSWHKCIDAAAQETRGIGKPHPVDAELIEQLTPTEGQKTGMVRLASLVESLGPLKRGNYADRIEAVDL